MTRWQIATICVDRIKCSMGIEIHPLVFDKLAGIVGEMLGERATSLRISKAICPWMFGPDLKRFYINDAAYLIRKVLKEYAK